MDDHVNPYREYRSYRPRRTWRGAITITTPTNSGTLALYHTGSAPHLIVIRDFLVVTTVAHLVAVALVNSSLGSSGGQIVPVVSGGAAGPGQLQSLDATTLLTADYYVPAQSNWPQFNHDFPFQVLQPGWSLQFQDTTAAETMRLAITWEAIDIAHFDFMDWPDGR